MKYPAIQNFINGQFVNSSVDRKMDVISPVDGTSLSTVPMSTSKDLDTAVKAAKAAFPGLEPDADQRTCTGFLPL
jgi:malonate-semialdehyde dehydrogenase (acetylating)/methylmalonate-semialdehyde dehydrogenase